MRPRVVVSFCGSSGETASLSPSKNIFSTQQAIFSNLGPLLAYYSSVTGLSLRRLMMRRNATVLIIMSLALARLSLGGCELRFEETKALMSKAPCRCF